jgi:hypothetical protein
MRKLECSACHPPMEWACRCFPLRSNLFWLKFARALANALTEVAGKPPEVLICLPKNESED